jgi:glyoxylase-like metal-dependent hydrolase (beta-lactamase superfamily II)
MRISEAGKICSRLWCLGREESMVYLLEGSESSMIINGGMSCILPDILYQMKDFGIDDGRIKKILILHAHFDHVGIVPFFKRRDPEVEIYASARAWEILKMSRAISTINLFSSLANENMKIENDLAPYDLKWRNDISSGVTVSEGDRISLGDLGVLILETPGHSSCSISAYVPKIKALFPSDGGGIPYKGEIITMGNSNYTLFQESLEKLKNFEADYICADHYGYVTGREAKTFIAETIDSAKKYRDFIESLYFRTGDIDTTVKYMVDATLTKHPDYFMREEILAGVYGQMAKHIAKVLEEKKS